MTSADKKWLIIYGLSATIYLVTFSIAMVQFAEAIHTISECECPAVTIKNEGV